MSTVSTTGSPGILRAAAALTYAALCYLLFLAVFLAFVAFVGGMLPRTTVATERVLTWHVGYLTASERAAAVEQTDGWTFGWQNSLTSGAEKVGTVQVAGRSWDHLERKDRQVTALLLRAGERTTLVTSKTGGLEEARALAASLPAASLSAAAGS